MGELRLSGINSGYDSEAMIKEMMSGYQTKIDKQNKKLTKLSWTQEAYRDITTKLTDFKNKYFDILKKDSYLMSPTTFTKFKSNVTTKSGDEAKGALSITTTENSKVGNHEIKVIQNASKAKVTGAKINPAGFSLDLEKAKDSSYKTTTVTNASGKTKNQRTYEFALDVKVGDVTKTVEFDFSIFELSNTGEVNQNVFSEHFRDALNSKLADAFGTTGGTDDKPFLQVSYSDPETLNFEVGANIAVSIAEKTGNFGLSKASTEHSISMQSCVNGSNTVAVTVGYTTKNVSFEGVSATYFDSRFDYGNEAVLEDFNKLKEAAYRKANNLSDTDAVDQVKLANFVYSSNQAAIDKNSTAFIKAGNEAFKDDGYKFEIDNGYVSIKQGQTDANVYKNFSIVSVEGGTLGLTKGNATNKISDNSTFKEIGLKNAASGIKINGKTIEATQNMTIKEFVDKVNKSDAGVTMKYSAIENRFIIESNEMGNGGNFEIEDNAFTKELGLTGAGAVEKKGKYAIFELDGEEIYHSSNSYEVDGTTFDFTDAVENETYKVGISKDYENIKTKIKDFVKDYNQLIDDVYKEIGTAPKRDEKNNRYEPLTDTEKEELSEKEIEKWEKAAKTGLLYNDSTVRGVMSDIRIALYNSVDSSDGKKFALYNMGISTMSMLNSPSEDVMRGKLEIDEEEFDKAFEEHADDIVKLFTDSENGIMKQVNTAIDNAVRSTGDVKGSLVRKAGLEKGTTATDNEIYKQMEQINKRIQTLQDRYDSKENYWWKVFTNLEKMMGEFNSQQAYMASYLGGGTTM